MVSCPTEKKNSNNKVKAGQSPSLANKLPKTVSKDKGKEHNISLKGISENNIPGMGPYQSSINPKKRRIAKSIIIGDSHQHSFMRDPHTKDKPTTSNVQHVNTIHKNNKNGPKATYNYNQGTSSPMFTSISTPNIHHTNPMHEGDKRNQEACANQNHVQSITEKIQNMVEGKNQQDENVPESPIDWEETE
jgi:hypothetical protein